jgi:hypothetical protein
VNSGDCSVSWAEESPENGQTVVVTDANCLNDDSDLDCPSCGGRMVPGRLRVKGTAPGFLFFGLSWQHVWWSDPEETRQTRQKVIVSGDQRPAARCVDCGMIAFMPYGSRSR